MVLDGILFFVFVDAYLVGAAIRKVLLLPMLILLFAFFFLIITILSVPSKSNLTNQWNEEREIF